MIGEGQVQPSKMVMIRDHITANLGIEIDDFDYAPFSRQCGLGKVHQLFGDELVEIIAAIEWGVDGIA